MKIKTIIFPFVGKTVGGSQIATILLIKAISSKFNVIVILFNRGLLEKILHKNGIKFFLLNTNKHSEFNPFNLKYIIKIIKLKIPNNCIVHTNDIRMHYFWSVMAIFFKLKHIWHQHSAYYSRRNIFFSYFSSKIIVVSKFVKTSLVFNMKRRSIVVGNPFKFKKINSNKNKLRKQIDLPLEKKIITFIGNTSKQKQYNFFLNLCNKLNLERKKRYYFLIFLSGKKKGENFKKLNDKNIKYFYNCFNLENHLKASDFLVSCSVNEGFGRVLVEGMYYENIVIASKSGAHDEIIKNNKTGFLINENSEESFKKKIIFCTDNFKSFDQLKKQAHNFTKKEFNLETYTNKIIKIYNSIN